MTSFFNYGEPLLRTKQEALDIQDICGLLKMRWQIGSVKLLSTFYTRLDQAFILWGWMTLTIFATAQFFPMSWTTQAYLWSVLTIASTLVMVALTRFWARVEQLSWVLYTWSTLMILGLVLTDLAVLRGWPMLLLNLCCLWLGISALGYGITGVGLRSRTFLLTGLVHILGILLLPLFLDWQFLFTGLVMGGSLLVLSELQWDMRLPIESPMLAPAGQQVLDQQ